MHLDCVTPTCETVYEHIVPTTNYLAPAVIFVEFHVSAAYRQVAARNDEINVLNIPIQYLHFTGHIPVQPILGCYDLPRSCGYSMRGSMLAWYISAYTIRQARPDHHLYEPVQLVALAKRTLIAETKPIAK